ncbi:hypothetical protein EASAB2608_05478 [Streptomyces sp. EAS-AB2608]|nr:hypothetical protein EASAB2608_05478 [Streptomyces sp. EAS-AB2608]
MPAPAIRNEIGGQDVPEPPVAERGGASPQPERTATLRRLRPGAVVVSARTGEGALVDSLRRQPVPWTTRLGTGTALFRAHHSGGHPPRRARGRTDPRPVEWARACVRGGFRGTRQARAADPAAARPVRTYRPSGGRVPR